MLSQGKELGAIDFDHIIASPLIAAVRAQAVSAMVTANFIEQVGFDTSKKLKTVDFDYSSVLPNLGGTTQTQKISVPLLSMLPIPFIRIDNMTIDLNVQLHSQETQKIANTIVGKLDDTTTESWLAGSTTFKASVTDNNTFQNDRLVDDTYSLRITVHAVQDKTPGGLGKILDILTNMVQDQAKIASAHITEGTNNVLSGTPTAKVKAPNQKTD